MQTEVLYGNGLRTLYTYDERSQLTELHREKDVVRYSYDPAGNLTEENYHTVDGASTKKLRYAYDVYNRNVSVTGDDFTQKNHYDAEGLRYAVTENGETTNFVYRNGMPVSELDADKNPVRGYVLGNEYISQSDGSIRNHYRYSAFGETITAEKTVPNCLRYNGQMADGMTGLYYLRARYYNASLGRFTQEDVIYNDGLNLYAYCNSNPVMYSDPSGFAKQCDPKVGGEKDSKSGTSSELKVIGTYDNNNYFTRAVEFNASSEGTGFTYKVYQRNDIDWNIVRTTGAKKGRGLTNAQAAEKYGLAPILNDGYVATLHHSQQRSVGPLFEASTRYHNISNAKKGPLHPYKGQLNPFNPMDSNTRGLFQKVDSIEYWKARGRDAMKGVQ